MSVVVFCLMGPTAIGKTDIACQLSEVFPFELISIDSSLVYQELNIGAAKPSADVLASYPHHLINICDLNQIYTVADCCRALERICEDIAQRQRIPLLVGGSMMYFHAFQHGLAKLPDADQSLRQILVQEWRTSGALKLHQDLQAFDPQSAARIHPNDTQRLLRAHEIYRTSGVTWSDYLSQAGQQQRFKMINLAMMPEPRTWLHDRIAQRFKHMLAQGLADEVSLIAKTYPAKLDHPALRSVGYRQVLQHLSGAYDVDTCLQQGIIATRQLAKRQMTWIRGMPMHQIFLQPNQYILQEMIAEIQEILDNEALFSSIMSEK